MTDTAIRPAALADIPAITRIYADAVRHGTASFEIDPPGEDEMARRMRALLQGNYPYLVAVENDAVVGFAYAGPYRPRPAYHWTVEDTVYVAADAQRRGIGRLLLNALIAEATARGFRQMIAVIGDSAHRPSIALHQAAGFRHIGTFQSVGYKFNRWLDSVLMQRSLGPGDTAAP